MKQYRIRKNDLVEVLAGKDKGKKGLVLKVLRKNDRVLVETVNICVRHVRPNPQAQQPGGRIEKEMPIHISNVGVCCPHCLKTVRVGYNFVEEVGKDGQTKTKKIRFCKKCNANIDQGGKKK